MRLFICNESGYYLRVNLYQEVVDAETGHVKFESWSSGDPGPYQGLPISTPVQTKVSLISNAFLDDTPQSGFIGPHAAEEIQRPKGRNHLRL